MVVTEMRLSNSVPDLRAYTWLAKKTKTQDSEYRFCFVTGLIKPYIWIPRYTRC